MQKALRRHRVTSLVVGSSLLVSGCVGPSRTLGDYEEKAANTAEAMISVVETARLVTGEALEKRVQSRYVSLVLSESEKDGASIATAFESVQPPGGEDADQLREELTGVLADATDVLERLRIAAYRDDREALADAAGALPSLRARLKPFMELTAT